MGTAEGALDVIRGWIGLRENNGDNHVAQICEAFGWCGVPWCAETVSEALSQSGTPLHEAAVINIRRKAESGADGWSWHGIDDGEPGDLICYDWGGAGNPNNMHVGMVEAREWGGGYTTIEGNRKDMVARWTNQRASVMGFARPPFDNAPAIVDTPGTPPAEGGYSTYPGGVFRLGSRHPFVRTLQHVANAFGCPAGDEDGDWGDGTEAGIECLQNKIGTTADGEWGPNSQAALDAAFKFIGGG